jgi:hypothetical protein
VKRRSPPGGTIAPLLPALLVALAAGDAAAQASLLGWPPPQRDGGPVVVQAAFDLRDRINVSFIGILTVVAYQIVLSEILPRISYMTLMNGFLNMSFFVICASVVINLWVGHLDRFGQTLAGDRIDRRCRWLFPLVYFGLLGLVAFLAFFVVG